MQKCRESSVRLSPFIRADLHAIKRCVGHFLTVRAIETTGLAGNARHLSKSTRYPDVLRRIGTTPGSPSTAETPVAVSAYPIRGTEPNSERRKAAQRLSGNRYARRFLSIAIFR